MAISQTLMFSRCALLSVGRHQQLIALATNSQRCLCPSVTIIAKRHRSKWNSKFPKEDEVTRIRKLNEEKNSQGSVDSKAYVESSDVGISMDSPDIIFSNYAPREKGQKITFSGILESMKMTLTTTFAIARLKMKPQPFIMREIAQMGQQKYIDSLMLLQKRMKRPLLNTILQENMTLILGSELARAFRSKDRKIYWRFVKEVRRPRIVCAILAKIAEDQYAQVTIRTHTKQIVAIKDRYDRIISGSMLEPVEKIEYIVLEKSEGSIYDKWRITAKFTPEIREELVRQQKEKRLKEKEKKKLAKKQEKETENLVATS